MPLPVNRKPTRGLLIVLIVALAGLVGARQALAAAHAPSPLPAQAVAPAATDAVAAADVARELSRLEAERDFEAIYDLLHPDARAAVPRAALVGWYEADLAGKRTAELSVTDVAFVSWTWGVTGKTYARTAEVSFVQPYWTDGVRTEVPGVLHLVAADGGWRWFFGASQAFLDQQIALYAPAAPVAAGEPDGGAGDRPNPTGAAEPLGPAAVAARAAAFPDPLHAHVDAYWAQRFADADRRYEPPAGVVGFDRPTNTACGRADPVTEAAFYCVLDETIYYSAEFRAVVEGQIGDFGWVVVVAHEWGHHIQLQLGFDLTPTLGVEGAGDPAPIELEQQADCLAGAYARDADATGWLDPGDVEEALVMTELAGDPEGTPWDDPFAHGSSAQRVGAFLEGFDGGLPACDLDL